MTGKLVVLLLGAVMVAVAVPALVCDADGIPTAQPPDGAIRTDAVAINDNPDPGSLPNDAVTWYAQTAFPLAARCRGMSCVESWPDSSFLYAIGGQGPYAEPRYADCLRYDVRTHTWLTLASMPDVCSNECAVWWTDNGGGTDSSGIYVLGKWDGPYDITATCYHWTKATNTWSSTEVPMYPGTPGTGNMAAVVGDSIFLMHQNVGTGVELHRYSIREGAWTLRATPPAQVISGGMCSYNGKVWQMGGWTATLGLQVYDPPTGSWTTLTSYVGTAGGNSPAIAGIAGRIYVWGGGDGWTGWSGVAYYDIAAGTWTTETSMPDAASGSFAGLIDSAGTPGMHRACGATTGAAVLTALHYRGAMTLPATPPTVTVTSPNGGEAWAVALPAVITCTHAGGTALTDSICLSLDGGTTWSFLFKEAAAATHTVPSVPNSPTTQARIQITATNAAGSNADASDADFSITTVLLPPTVRVVTPNGGETWAIGGTATITCTHLSGAAVTDSICLSLDGGATYSFMFKEAAAGTHTVPSVPNSPTTRGRIQITAINAAGSDADASDADFSIVTLPPTVTVTAPNGGETWTVALPATITCTHAGGAAVTDSICLSLDGGATYGFMFKEAAAATHNVTSVPNSPTTRARILITAINDAGSNADTGDASFTIAAGAVPPGSWHAQKAIPGALVKDGGAMAYNADNKLIYEMKGNKTLEFNSYNPADSTWTALSPIPAGLKAVKAGASMATGAGKVFVTKGNNTLEFYRYDIGDSVSPGGWLPATRTVPLGAGKKVKAGGSMAFVHKAAGDFVYLLKGYGTEFYRYDVAGDNFTALAHAPDGMMPKYDKGSWIVYDGDRYLYVYKSKYGPDRSEFYRYDVLAEAWVTTPTLNVIPIEDPMLSRRQKVADGSAAAFGNGALYAFKGNNSSTFWKYAPTDSVATWAEFETIPQVSQPGDRKKKVKSGAALAYYPDGNVFFAQKGNKTNQFWMYRPGTGRVYGTRPERDGVTAAGRLAICDCQLSIAPNPIVGSRVLHLTAGPLGHSTTISIYDALGRLVLARPLGHSTTNLLDVRNLSAGVYLVKLSSDGYTTSQKLVIER